MTARATAVREREEAVTEAAFEAFFSRHYDEVTLREIAASAGVTEQTVLRRFGSKEGLLAAVVDRHGRRLGSPREPVAPGDYRSAVEQAVASYEQSGTRILHVLDQERRTPVLQRVTEKGRAAHYELTAQVFAPWLPAPDEPGHREALGPFVVALDVYTWKLLRLDLGLSRRQTVAAITRMVEGLIGPATEEDDDG